MGHFFQNRYIVSLFLIVIGSLVQAQQTVGLFLNTEESLNGYTLFTPMLDNKTYLIDNCGYVINTWESEYSPNFSSYLLEDGTLLRTVTNTNDSVKGGAERYDWYGNLIWSLDFSYEGYYQHHDIEYLPNGNILFLVRELKTAEEAIEMGGDPSIIRDMPIMAEIIVEVEPIGNSSGNIIWEWHAWDHMVQDFDDSKPNYATISEHPELVNINFREEIANKGIWVDFIHANSIDYNDALDQILISSRSFSEIWVIDHSTTTEEAASHTGGQYGKGGDLLYRWGNPQCYNRGSAEDQTFFNQHDANWIPEDYPDEEKIMVFNNNNVDNMDNMYSSTEVINPPINEEGLYELNGSNAYGPIEPDWMYIASPPESFHSRVISGAQRLSNGNTLICEGEKGRLFEIDYEGNMVWEYINPVEMGVPIEQGSVPRENAVFRAYRYGEDYPAFTDKVLIPGDPIELNPLPYDCTIYNTVGIEEEINNEERFLAYPNPFNDEFSVLHKLDVNVTICIYDITGQLMHKSTVKGNVRTVIPSLNWNRGVYIVRLSSENGIKLGEYKIIKLHD